MDSTELESYSFKFYCSDCETTFYVPLTKEPTQVVCPNGHLRGVWSLERVYPQPCGVCEGKPVITVVHERKRHDKLNPKGELFIVPDGRDTKAIFEHFAKFHVDILKKSGLVKVKEGR